MLKINDAIKPEEIKRSRDAVRVQSLEIMNKIIDVINNRLVGLRYGGSLSYSFIGEGYGTQLIEPVAEHFDMAGWDVLVFGEPSRDMGIKISWPDQYKNLKNNEERYSEI